MLPIIKKMLVAVVVAMMVLGMGTAGKVVPSEAATTTDLMCALSPVSPVWDVPWSSTRERPGQPY
jgi:hypothetical protein